MGRGGFSVHSVAICAVFDSVKFMMRNRVVSESKCIRGVTVWMVRGLFGVFSGIALLGACEALSAQGQKTGAKPVQPPTVKRHEPLAGKACADCHKRVVSSKVRCLLAKDQMCILCHDIPVDGGPARLVDAPEPVCFKCHIKGEFKGNFSHGPFAVGACIACHDPHGGNVPGMLRIAGRQLCLECHKNMSVRFANARFPHKAAATACTDCHSPHISDQRSMLKSAVPGLCGKCHEKVVKDLQTAVVKHSPVTEPPACMNCHDPHAAQEGSLLLADGLDICLQCHDKTVKSGNQEFIDMKQLLAANPYPHGPIQNRDCSACHNPHSSPYYRLLTNQYPQGFYSPFFTSNYDLCFRCHDSALATDERTTRMTAFRDGDRNLHFVHVNKTSHGRTCRSCHVVHASAIPKHIGATVPFGTWKLPVKFEQTENGGSCAPGCHAVQKYDRQSAKSGKQ
jgi:predicted CXXCH cytochrome family protein